MLSPVRPTSRASLASKREIGRGLDVGGRNAHQPDDRQTGSARLIEQGGQIGDGATALLVFRADIDLYETVGAAAGFAIALPNASTSDGRSTEWIASNSATASSALFD